jgi:hypothetical protein
LGFELLVVAAAAALCPVLGLQLPGADLPLQGKEKKAAGPERDYSEGA